MQTDKQKRLQKEFEKGLSEGLSKHLLRESEKFWIYPVKRRRTKGNLAMLKLIEDQTRQRAEWRKTFAPRPARKSDELGMMEKAYSDFPLLNQYYSRDLLREVPAIVERDQKLSQLVLSGIEDKGSFVYLREAANCYILGLPQAAIALSRAAVEAHLRNALEKIFGGSAVRGAGLKELVKDYARRGQLLSSEGLKSANKVRVAGDDVLHEKPADSGSALEVIEAARAVILELERKK